MILYFTLEFSAHDNQCIDLLFLIFIFLINMKIVFDSSEFFINIIRMVDSSTKDYLKAWLLQELPSTFILS